MAVRRPAVTLEQAARAVEAVKGLGYSQKKAAALAGISQSTVSVILSGNYRWGEVANGPVFNELRLYQKKAFQVATFELAKQALEQVEKTLPKASFLQAVTGYGILRDKERLDAGEPTEIHVSLNLNHSLALDKLIELLGYRLIDQSDYSTKR